MKAKTSIYLQSSEMNYTSSAMLLKVLMRALCNYLQKSAQIPHETGAQTFPS